MRLLVFCLAFVCWVSFSGLSAYGDEGEWNTVGLRAGKGDGRNDESFSQYEVYGTYTLPYRWTTKNNWTIGTLVGLNAGILTCEGNGLVVSIGPGLYLLTPQQRWVMWLGIFPTYIDEAVFGRDDFGSTFQFTSAIGFNYNFLEHMTIGYRWQHMSNAGISDENPGINLHMIELGYRF